MKQDLWTVHKIHCGDTSILSHSVYLVSHSNSLKSIYILVHEANDCRRQWHHPTDDLQACVLLKYNCKRLSWRQCEHLLGLYVELSCSRCELWHWVFLDMGEANSCELVNLRLFWPKGVVSGNKLDGMKGDADTKRHTGLYSVCCFCLAYWIG